MLPRSKARPGAVDLVVANSRPAAADQRLLEGLAEEGALCVSSVYVVEWLAKPWSALGHAVLLGEGEGGVAEAAARRRCSVEGEEVEPEEGGQEEEEEQEPPSPIL